MAEKKFLNCPETIVDDSLNGLILSSAGKLRLSKDSKRVVLRTDQKPKVKLIAGGGSGHEPYAAGYVGEGLLDAAICGDVFASPPSRNVHIALEETKCDAGAILFVINYTGDRLNFGLAAERFKRNGGTVNIITIADDVSLKKHSKTGRRGLAGAVFVIKMAGAMAERGDTLDDITRFCEKCCQHIGTVGVALAPCSLPGQSKMFELGIEEMEVGLGIHGEPGIERTNIKSANEIIDIIVSMLIKEHDQEKEFVVMLNNLGATSEIEMNCLRAEVLNSLDKRGLVIRRLLVGSYMSSLNGHSISLSLFGIFTPEVLHLIDAPAKTFGWKKVENIEGRNDYVKPIKHQKAVEVADFTPACDKKENEDLKQIVLSICTEMIQRETELNKLDSSVGDGDCGFTFSRAGQVVLDKYENNNLKFYDYRSTLEQIAEIFDSEVGGTSGAIYALMIGAASNEIREGTSEELLIAFEKGLEIVRKYGKADPGDRTMVDSLFAAVSELKAQDLNNVDWNSVLEKTRQGALSTSEMKAAAGRASYTPQSAQVIPDAGAMAFYYWLKAAIQK